MDAVIAFLLGLACALPAIALALAFARARRARRRRERDERNEAMRRMEGKIEELRAMLSQSGGAQGGERASARSRAFAREASASLSGGGVGGEAFASPPQGESSATLLEEKSRLVEMKAMEMREALRIEAQGGRLDASAGEAGDERLRESILSLASRFAAAAEGPTGEAIDEILAHSERDSRETGLASRIRALREAKREGENRASAIRSRRGGRGAAAR